MAALLPQPIQFGKYTLFERIGRGGMADVFKARIQGPAGFERIFVVKRILPHLSEDPAFTAMFIEEAKMSARLSHPNIVQVFELGSVDTEYFISMEHVRGRDLAETMRVLWARLGPPRPELVAYIGREMCRALAYAHGLSDEDGSTLGLIHRDVSPSNVMLSYEGGVKLLDFGIAKALGDTTKEENTKSGTLKGKFAYMAPEQTEGHDVDRRIDIFAAGIVLHEVLTGRRLFKAANDLQTIERVRQCRVERPSALNPVCPPDLDEIVLKALSRNRDDRFQVASEMADALDDIVHATRFQPDHLAQLMHELFPEAGPGPDHRPATGSMSASTSSTTRTPGRGTGSPTLPAVSVTRSLSPTRPPDLAPTENLPLWKQPPYMAGGAGVALLVVVLIVVLAGKSSRPPVAPPPAASTAMIVKRPADGNIKVSVESMPAGADVFVEGGSDPVGQTPTSFPVAFDEHIPTRITVRKSGYDDYVAEIVPSRDQPIIAGLRPRTAGSPTASADKPAAQASRARTSAPKKRRSRLDRGGLVDPF